MHPLARFSVDDLVDLSDVVRGLGGGAGSMVAAAQRITDHLHRTMVDDAGQPACLGVRLYKTHRVGGLTPERRAVADRVTSDGFDDKTWALVLLAATDGPRMPPPQPREQVRPLTPDALAAGGLLLQLIDGLGLDPAAIVDPETARGRQLHQQTYNAFLIPDVLESDWVKGRIRAGIEMIGLRSLLAIGGVLITGEIFFVALFTALPIPERTADLMRSLAPAVQASLTPFVLNKVFEPQS